MEEDMVTDLPLDEDFVLDWGPGVITESDINNTHGSESIVDASLSIKDCPFVLNTSMYGIDFSENTLNIIVSDNSSLTNVDDDANTSISQSSTTENSITETKCVKNNSLKTVSVDVDTVFSQNTLGSIGVENECYENNSRNISVDLPIKTFPNISENILVETKSNIIVENTLNKKECKINRPLEKIKLSTLIKYKDRSKIEIVYSMMKLGLYASRMQCPKCNKEMTLVETKMIADGYIWRCRGNVNNKHESSKSVRFGSFLAGSKLSILDILILIHCWVYEVPYKWVLLEFRPSSSVLAEWYDFFRDVCVEFCAREDCKIGGTGKLVEIEGQIYTRRKNSENVKKNSFVFIGTQDMYAEVSFLKIAGELDKSSFLEVIKSSVLPGSTIISQFCADFSCHTSPEFSDLEKSHLFSYGIPKSGDFVKRKNFWDVVRKCLPSHRSTNEFDHYLAEYIWRKKTSDVYDVMREFLNAIKTIYPPPYLK